MSANQPCPSADEPSTAGKLHLAAPGSLETLCGLPVAAVAVGLYTTERDERTGRPRAGIASAMTGRVGRSCRGCLAIYRGRCLAALVVA